MGHILLRRLRREVSTARRVTRGKGWRGGGRIFAGELTGSRPGKIACDNPPTRTKGGGRPKAQVIRRNQDPTRPPNVALRASYGLVFRAGPRHDDYRPGWGQIRSSRWGQWSCQTERTAGTDGTPDEINGGHLPSDCRPNKGHVRQGGVTPQRHPDHQLAATSSPFTSSTASPSITSSRALASDSALM